MGGDEVTFSVGANQPVLPAQSPFGEDSLCQQIISQEPALLTAFTTDQPPVIDLSGQPGMTPIFQPLPTMPGREMIPDVMSANPDELAAWAQTRYDRELRSQIGQLTTDFPACAPYNLRENISRLPRLFQEAFEAYADDEGIYFQIDYVRGSDGQYVPHINLFRRGSDPTRPLGPIVADERSRFELDDAYPLMAGAGFLRPSTAPEGPNPGERVPAVRGLGANPILSGAVTIGGAALLYLTIDRTAERMEDWTDGRVVISPEWRGLYNFGGTVLAYEGLGRLGVVGRPQWGPLFRAMPSLMVVQFGSSYLYDGLGLPIGSTGNTLASLATTTGVYIYAPRLATTYAPRAVSAFRAITGLGEVAAGGGTVAAGSGGALLVGGTVLVEAAGVVLAIEGIGQMVAMPLIDYLADDGSPNTKLWWAAQDYDYNEYAQTSDGWTGISARNFSFINKGFLGWGLFFSSDFRNNYNRGIQNVIDNWIDQTNRGVDHIDNLLLAAAASSLEPSADGNGYRVNREHFQEMVTELFGREPSLHNWYEMANLIAPTDWSYQIEEATEITALVSENGWIRDRDGMTAYASELVAEADRSGRLNQILTRIAAGERDVLDQRLAQLGLQRDPSRPPPTTSDLNPEQRAFLYGNGGQSESVQRTRRLAHYQQLVERSRQYGSFAAGVTF